MTRAAVTDIDGLAVDDRELRRTGTSFTVDTLAAWRNEYGETPSLVFIVGADVLPALPHWHDWQRLLDYCHLAVMARSNANQQLPTDVEHWLTRHAGTAQTVHQQAAGSVIHIAQPTLAVSSTQLRAALQHGRNLQFLLPQAVIEYIAQHDLYETGASPCDTP